jgi:MinD-like ATPase involved in chromosome partitioning or flagellar assembly
LAAVLAGCAAGRRAGPVVLLDCDPLGGGIDVLLGCEQVPGARWRQVRLRGGAIDPVSLLSSLPRWGGVSFLAADTAADLDPSAVAALIEASTSLGTVVIDLPRWPSVVRARALAGCDRVVLVTPAEVRAVTAAALVAAGLDTGRSSVAVRGASKSLPPDRIGALLGLPVTGAIPYDPALCRPGGVQLSRLRRATRQLADALLGPGGGALSETAA